MHNKPLVPTNTGEAPVFAAQRRRYAIQMKSLLGVLTVLLPWNAVLACANLERDFGLMFPSEKSTIHGPMSVEQAERDRLVELQESGRVVPFGYLNERWEALKQQIREGDRLFRVESHGEGFTFFKEHFVLVRDGCVVDAMRTTVS